MIQPINQLRDSHPKIELELCHFKNTWPFYVQNIFSLLDKRHTFEQVCADALQI